MISVPAFPRTVSVALGQAWRPTPEEGFRPGTVRLAWKPGKLVVHAELIDDAIHTRAKGFNERLWELGDTFEMFLRPLPDEAYLEYHVAPGNHVLQLRFPSDRVIRGQRDGSDPRPPEAFLIPKKAFESETQIGKGKWEVRATIPDASVRLGRQWKFSFSRYDATPHREHAILSSTSAHTVVDFHDQSAWKTLVFAQE
ncbi:MAG: hypothetical protein SFU56_02320 [Capsulimonadales bacterium]|nr:hypothetical protein [Capsulimonadales bacterium]